MRQQNRQTNGKPPRFGTWSLLWLATIALLAGVSPARAAQETFATPEAAVEALIAANRADDPKSLVKILGPESKRLVFSGDPVADQAGRARFLKAYDTRHEIEAQDDARRTLVVGEEEWPMPIPLVREGALWRFDTDAGAQEILARRIGRNELNVIAICRSYVEAQRDYAQTHKAGGKALYARKIISSPGKEDGLYWPAVPGEKESPLGPVIAAAAAEGYDAKAEQGMAPYHGYFFRILTRQGTAAPEGTMDYVLNGRMTRGFALIAWPARYGTTGVMTFIVNQDGIVYEKNLGPATAGRARKMTAYNPDRTWKTPS